LENERLWRLNHSILFSKDNAIVHDSLRSYFDRNRDFGPLTVPAKLRRVLPLRADWKLPPEKVQVPAGLERSKSVPTSRPKNCPAWNPNAFILFSAQNDIADMNTRSYFDRPRERRDLHRDAAAPEPLVNTWSLEVDRNPKIRRNAEFFAPIPDWEALEEEYCTRANGLSPFK